MKPLAEEINIIEFLDQVPAPYREPAELYYLEKMTQKAIAQKLNISIAVTRHRLAKGKFLLKKLSNHEDYIYAKQLLQSRAYLYK